MKPDDDDIATTSRRKRRKKQRGHCRKRRFHDHEQAVDVLHQIAGKRSRSDNSAKRRELRAYYCPRCTGWHLTSQPFHELLSSPLSELP